MADGSLKPIETLQTGDSILGEDPALGEVETEAVIAPLQSVGDKHLIALYFDDDPTPVIATDNHPFRVQDLGWTDASDLVPGDVAIGSTGRIRVLSESDDLGEFARPSCLQPARLRKSHLFGHGRSWPARPVGAQQQHGL